MEYKWIKVEDALPPKEEGCDYSKSVLVYIVAKNKRIEYTMYSVSSYDFSDNEWRLAEEREAEEYEWMDDSSERTTFKVTHWIPIPPIEEK